MNVLLNEDEKKLYYPKPETFLMKSQLKMDKKSLVDKSLVDKSLVDKSSVDKSSVDKSSVDKSSVDVNIRRLIQTIPKYRYHFQIIEKETPVVIEGSKASPTGSKASPSDWTSIQQNDIGISTTLLSHLQKRWEQDHVSFLTHIMDIHSYLLQSIDKLLEKKIVHNAIEEKHILYSEQIEAPILVYFLESYIISDLVGGGSDENLKDLEEESDEEESGEESDKESDKEPSTENKIPETWDKTCLHNCILKCIEQIITNPNEDEKKFTDFLKKNGDENKT